MDNLTTKHTDILSESFQNLKEIALKEKANYLNAKPFPNIDLNTFGMKNLRLFWYKKSANLQYISYFDFTYRN